MRETRRRVTRGEVTLAGSVWSPASAPRALVVTYPGSGPASRDNDGYFAPIHSLFLEVGCVVAGFDKRGVGGSTGDWRDASIEEQAADLLAFAGAVHDDPIHRHLPVGLFGHSQGGWVVVEAGSRSDTIDFVIMNSGPGVTPAGQERFAARRSLEMKGAQAGDVERVLAAYDRMLQLARSGAALSDLHTECTSLLPDPSDEGAWRLWGAILDYDPRRALSALAVPVLAIYGGSDPIVPVDESIAVLREAVPPDRLTVEVFPGAGHRIEVGDPPRLAPGYGKRLRSFLDDTLQS